MGLQQIVPVEVGQLDLSGAVGLDGLDLVAAAGVGPEGDQAVRPRDRRQRW